jgi:uncharacterized repeat protein (TIGR01451 family)
MVHVFVRSGTTWTLQQRLTPSSGADGDNFGLSVSVYGDSLVVGAPGSIQSYPEVPGSAFVFARSGSVWTEQQRLTASDAAIADRFATSVSMSADTVVVGAPEHDTPAGANAGAAYVFVRSGGTWTEQQALAASDGAASDAFGASAAIDGDTVVVGAPQPESPVGAGSAYVFVRSGATWAEEQKLATSDGAAGDGGGTAVAVSANTAVVGAPGDDTPAGTNAGSACVFVRSGSTWTEQQRLTASDAAPADVFGSSVSVSGETVVGGSPYHATAAGARVGSAYVFVRSGSAWSEEQELLADDGTAFDYFGDAVSASGDTVLVGAWLAENPGGQNQGTADVFVRSGTTWTAEQELVGADDPYFDDLGYSISVSGDALVVGAPQDNTTGGVSAGSAYVFVRSGGAWSLQQKLMASDGANGDRFGQSVSISGDTVVVGAPNHYVFNAVHVGAAYVFARSGAAWTEQQKLIASDAGPYGLFGWSVAADGDTVLAGAMGADMSRGAAYAFVRSGAVWTEQQKLVAPDGIPLDEFGSSLSISGDTAVICARGYEAGYVFVRSGGAWTAEAFLFPPGQPADSYFCVSCSVSGSTLVAGAVQTGGPGAAYVYVGSGSGWTQQQRLLASDGAGGDRFGGSVAVSGDTVVVGAPYDDAPATDRGSAYVFTRSGTVWTEQWKLVAPDGEAADGFGSSASVSGDTVAVGAPYDDFPSAPAGTDAGTAHVFRDLLLDLSVTKTDGQATAVPGQAVTYTITVANAGPGVAEAVAVSDPVPAALHDVAWTCAASPGSACASGGSGSIDDSVRLLAGGTASYALTGTIDAAATGTLANTATVSALPGADPDPADNSATDTDTLTPQADLSVTKTDGSAVAIPGGLVTYGIGVANAGPSAVAGALVSDPLPPELSGATWTCSASPGSTCAASGSGGIADSVGLASGGLATYTLTASVDAAATGTLSNTATVAAPPGVLDPTPGNDSANDTDSLLSGVVIEGELAHGYRRQHSLAALPGPVAAEHVFRFFQRPQASYEVLLDGVTGDLGSGSGPVLERLGSDASTLLQASSPAGAGGSRVLRWMNPLDTPVADEFVAVRSAGCSVDCDASDVYRLSVAETTGFIPRFNNSGSQVTILILENGGDTPMDVAVRFWGPAGASIGGPPVQTLGPRQAYVLDTSTLAPGASGAITVENTGSHGQLAGKAVAVEPATGFTFDTPLTPRSR